MLRKSKTGEAVEAGVRPRYAVAVVTKLQVRPAWLSSVIAEPKKILENDLENNL
jgi:hypothetical protein